MATTVQCGRCGSIVESLQSLDAATQKQLGERNSEEIPAQICMNCYRGLVSGSAANPGGGSILLAQERAKEQRKVMLWKSRVGLIKRARMLTSERAFSDAAVAYEKYLRVLEVVFDVQSGGLTPEQFKDSARTQELTVVASVYWDLLRIYDTSERYGDRQALAAQKLAQFLRFTPIYPDIVRKAESFSRTAKNPTVIRNFLKSATESKGKCFVASAAFESEICDEVLILRTWREVVLRQYTWGRRMISMYETLSPLSARALNKMPLLKPLARSLLLPIVKRAARQTLRHAQISLDPLD